MFAGPEFRSPVAGGICRAYSKGIFAIHNRVETALIREFCDIFIRIDMKQADD
jgi:hypothetical protein